MIEENIIIDTDIGDDIDDALALTYALKSPCLNILGITTVFKDTVLRAKLAKKLLAKAGRADIPVHVGSEHPLSNKVDNHDGFSQYESDLEDYIVDESKDAVAFMAEKIYEHKGNITLIAIGPLTNIAKVIDGHPGIEKHIKSIYLMGGSYYRHANEWNILCDPEAANIVMKSGIDVKAIGLDVTLDCRLSDEDISRIKSSDDELIGYIAKLTQQWMDYTKWPVVLHDPLTICAITKPELFQFVKESILVELKGEVTRGTTYNLSSAEWWQKERDDRNVWVAESVKQDDFVKEFMDKLLN